MINRDKFPVAWSEFIYNLSDAQEHIGTLLKEIANDPEFDDVELRIHLGHIYAHLNRAWNLRNNERESTEADWEAARNFPTDLDPIV